MLSFRKFFQANFMMQRSTNPCLCSPLIDHANNAYQ
jgi:hypothetical protein